VPNIDCSILDAIAIPELWQPWFKDPATWARWRAFLKTVFGLSMTEPEFAFFQECRVGRCRIPRVISKRG